MKDTKYQSLFFQAIGLLKAVPEKDPLLGWVINLDGIKHRLFIPPHLYRNWLKQINSHDIAPLYLRVYPRAYMIKKQEPSIFFQVVAWQDENNKNEAINVFTIKGIWQFIPQSRLPVLSIYRNIKSNDFTMRYKATHLPIIMRRDDCQPYRFLSNKSAKEVTRYFVQSEFIYLPDRQAFKYKGDIAAPVPKIPRHKKPVKGQEKKAVPQ